MDNEITYNIGLFLILVFLLPGFLSLKVKNSLWAMKRERQTTFEKVVDALIFALINYGIALLILRGVGFWRVFPETWGMIVSQNTPTRHLFGVLGVASATGVLTGFLSGRIEAWDFPHIVLRTMRMANTSQVPTPWLHAFTKWRKRVLWVHLEDGSTVIGEPTSICQDEDDRSLFMTNARVVGEDGSEREVVGPGVLITKLAGIRTIEFWEKEKEPNEEHNETEDRQA